LVYALSLSNGATSPKKRDGPARKPMSLFEVIEISFLLIPKNESQNQYDLALASRDDGYKEPPLKFSKRGHSPNCQRASQYSYHFQLEGKAPKAAFGKIPPSSPVIKPALRARRYSCSV
jgi:hypothetical protein